MTDTRLISFNAGDADALVFEKLNQLSGQVTGLLDAGGGGGGGSSPAWALAGTGQTATGVYDFAVDGAKLNIDFIGLAAFNELLVVARGLTDGTVGSRSLYVSVDNGVGFFTTSGDYVDVDGAGVEVNVTQLSTHATPATAAKSVISHIVNMKGAHKVCQIQGGTSTRRLFVASALDINAVRIANSAGGNITAGTVRVYAR